jgi:hypothetical protein
LKFNKIQWLSFSSLKADEAATLWLDGRLVYLLLDQPDARSRQDMGCRHAAGHGGWFNRSGQEEEHRDHRTMLGLR